MKPLSRKIWNLTAGFIVGVVILMAIIVGLFRLMVVHVPEYKQQIERLASDATGMLWAAYDPYRLWYQFAAVGLVSAVGMLFYSRWVRKVEAPDI